MNVGLYKLSLERLSQLLWPTGDTLKDSEVRHGHYP